jgi:Protein of unknown function (DUF3017)
VLTVVVGYRPGGYSLALTLAVAALLRGVLPPQRCLGLIVRSRRADVATTVLLAIAVALAAWIVPGGDRPA